MRAHALSSSRVRVSGNRPEDKQTRDVMLGRGIKMFVGGMYGVRPHAIKLAFKKKEHLRQF